ncbi:MAG: glycosyltransferase [Armatimonadetes bacterium]|nr:glycosyltransferase [Armatimonadota bacterium]MBS1728048.1 glycosyltransferase family 4 protein [Armatimonadota bacterium]
MRIIIANDNAVVSGGATKCALLQAEGLAKLGHEVHFFSGFAEVDPYFASVPGIQFHNCGETKTRMDIPRLIEMSYLQKAYDKLTEIIKLGDPKQTIVHTHLWKTGISPSVVNAALDSGAHLLSSFHDYHVACPQGQFFNKQTNRICTLTPGSVKCLCTHCTDTRTILPKWAEVYRWRVQRGKAGMPGKVRHFGVFSQKSVDAFGQYLPQGAKLHMMHYPIQAVHEPRVDVTKNRAIVFSGRLSIEKDPRIFVEAAKKIGAEVRILGDGPLMQAVKDIGYDKATFLGWLSGDQVLAEMKNARAMAITSIWYEVNPLAPIEALGRGIPVIASDCTSTKYEIVEGETGFAFQAHNVDDLADKMKRLLDDETADRMSRAAYDRFWANPPTMENHVKRLIEIYEEMLAE